MEWMNALFEQYGYVLLFFGLLAESLALPFPGELAMAVAGHLAYFGNSNYWLDVTYAFLGATIGTTITYALGRKLGTPFIEKYGKYIFLNKKRFAMLADWFDKYGSKILLVSYFIPGFRHFTGYMSGVLRIRFRTFLLFNHFGALVWVIVYVSIGRLFGAQFEKLLHLISAYSRIAVAILAVVLALVLFFKMRRARLAKRAGPAEAPEPASAETELAEMTGREQSVQPQSALKSRDKQLAVPRYAASKSRIR
ncbi:DedA family protein [Cohnella zeiphila]|uniref:VTT domain-containing protein n=1 Tax=Cohnella zeiphila TaxID=2761120 RepID=A0A7X0VY79_9BACL|nr:DedA family protein [Cohnella zeiphila]MBB6734410.1 VTT domain-containing protein [Cohnella zeiphila]